LPEELRIFYQDFERKWLSIKFNFQRD